MDVPPTNTSVSSKVGQTRQSKRKTKDWVNSFDPRETGEPFAPGLMSAYIDQAVDKIRHQSGQNIASAANLESRTHTNSFISLVDSFREAREILNPKAFRKLRLRVVTIGNLRWVDYFVDINRFIWSSRDRVLEARARLIRSYGSGFKLRLLGTDEGVNVTLYVANTIADQSSVGNLRRDEIAQLKAGEEVMVYLMGHRTINQSWSKVEIVLDSARKLDLRRVSKSFASSSLDQVD